MNIRHTTQYTIRNVPAEVDRRLRDSARHQQLSLNQALLALLARASGASEAATTYRDLDSFFGSWTADAKVDQALAEQRTIDKKLWR